MPATNDINEGMLGSFHQYCHFNPQATLHMFNALPMYQRNDTQHFMDRNFQEDNHKFLMKMGWEVEWARRKKTGQDCSI